MRYLRISLPVVALTALVACQPADRESELNERNDDLELPSVNVEAHRDAVEEAMQDTRERLESLRDPMEERSEEAWQEISNRADDTWNEVQSSLDRTLNGDADDLHESRSDLARHLAELESEIAAEEVRLANTPAEVGGVVEEWLDRLMRDVSTMNSSVSTHAENEPDQEDLDTLRERMAEVREELREMTADPESFEDRREDVANDLADLTVQVREYHYLTDWSNRAVAAR